MDFQVQLLVFLHISVSFPFMAISILIIERSLQKWPDVTIFSDFSKYWKFGGFFTATLFPGLMVHNKLLFW